MTDCSLGSFSFRYPLNRNPYIAGQLQGPVIYPYAAFGDFATSSNLYVYGRQVPFRSYFASDINLSARPVSRIIQPSVLEYAPIVTPPYSQALDTPVTVTPVLNNRFAALDGGNQPMVEAVVATSANTAGKMVTDVATAGHVGDTENAFPILLGAQASQVPQGANKWMFLLALLVIGGVVYWAMKK